MRLRKTGSILVLSCSLAAASLDVPLNTGIHRSPTRSKRPHEGAVAWNGCCHFALSIVDPGVQLANNRVGARYYWF